MGRHQDGNRYHHQHDVLAQELRVRALQPIAANGVNEEHRPERMNGNVDEACQAADQNLSQHRCDLFSGGIVPAALGGPGIHAFGGPLDNSFIGGGTIGCNWQPVGSPFVLGIEGEGGFMQLSGARFDPFVNATMLSPVPDVLGAARIGDWYAMATGRIGYAWDRWMIYLKGGAAFVPIKASVIDNCTTGGCGNWLIATFVDDTRTVGTIGGGVEWAFAPNWSLKAEYMFIALNNNGITSCGTATLVSGAVVPGGAFCFGRGFPDLHTFKVGINWRLGTIFGP
jgi:outer membrane immunogenic protein